MPISASSSAAIARLERIHRMITLDEAAEIMTDTNVPQHPSTWPSTGEAVETPLLDDAGAS